jgi:hypothetical protein
MPAYDLTPTRRRVIIVAAVVLAAAIAGAAFALTRGGRGGAGPPANGFNGGAPPADAPDSSAFQQFQQCLEQHGVTLTPGERPDFDDSTMRSAMTACRRYLPARPGGFRGDDNPDRTST